MNIDLPGKQSRRSVRSGASETRIPRIMHEGYLSGSLTPELQANIDQMTARNARYEHRLYDARREEKRIRTTWRSSRGRLSSLRNRPACSKI
jgi:hypothetical protein